ncbi:metalloprotease PmbA [Ketobacter sp.]|uniref:metalloprotease PmbA n=1 Tax=Ketobacter sp. TaxID=2083498 RepID=UPI0025C5A830|nr:metalloprotease PmbA [Ketobacter sp.]
MDIERELDTLQDRIRLALHIAEQHQATAEVGAYQDQGLSVSVRNGDVDKVEFTRNHGFGITVYRGQCKGSASTSDFSDAAIERAVKAALDVATHTAPDACSGLADAALMARDIADLDLYHPWAIDPQQAIQMAQACEAAGLSQPHIKNSDGAYVGTSASVRAYGNSHGLVVAYPQSRHGISCALIAAETGPKGETMERGGWSYSHRVPGQLQEGADVGRKAAERAARKLGSRAVPTGEFPVLYAPEIAGGLLGHFIGAISGGSLYRHSSFLENSLGQTLFPDWMNIFELPHLPQGPASAPVDGDGLATYGKHFVEQGILKHYVLGTYSARRLGLQSTANAGGVRNLRCSSTHSLDELLSMMGTGLLVTDVMGQGVNLVTGHYSRGAAGFWVENGTLQFPVSEVTVAANLRDMFRNLRGVGSDVDARGNVQVGSILVDSMTVAGK